MSFDLTFGICSDYKNLSQLTRMIHSIQALNIPKYEILVAGSYPLPEEGVPTFKNTWHVLSDRWLPTKKNIITKIAKFETLVLAHDYYEFDPSWYEAYRHFNKEYKAFAGHEWDICSNPQFLIDGTRHATDWITWDDPTYGRYWSLPYDDWSHTQHQYISGGYFLARREVLQKAPLNESLPPGSPEDVEWSLRVRDWAKIACNPHAIVRHIKRHRDVGNLVFPLHTGCKQ